MSDRTRFVRSKPARASELSRLLPLLTHAQDLAPAEWLRTSMTTFGKGVVSFLPGHFEAYARVFHPFVHGQDELRGVCTWRELAADAHVDLMVRDLFGAVEEFAPDSVQARRGSLPAPMIGPLLEHLGPATSTAIDCWFAIWEGFGGSVVPGDLPPKLELPNRRYHVFSGSLAAAHTSFLEGRFHHQSANLWWPADHAWCVATEIDHHWTYLAGGRACIDAVLADPRLESIETTATSRV